MHASEKVWYAVDVVTVSSAREAAEYALMEAGALGTETVDQNDEARVSGYFEALPARELVREKLFEAMRLYGLLTSDLREMSLREVVDRDWLGEWKRGWQPVAVGRRFIIAPPWSEVEASDDRIIIRIEPGMAFGTGTHETTRLCLAAIEKYFAGESFLDVGTGTGILAIAAAMLCPHARIEACDTDPDAISIARENARLNDVEGRVRFRVGTVEETSASADLVCANLTADVIVPLLPALTSATCRQLILSGILDTQTEQVVQALGQLGITQVSEIATDGEWVAIVV